MSSAVERLATELVKLSAEEWTKLAELRRVAKIAERLSELELERDPVTTIAADEEAIDEAPKVILRSWDQT